MEKNFKIYKFAFGYAIFMGIILANIFNLIAIIGRENTDYTMFYPLLKPFTIITLILAIILLIGVLVFHFYLAYGKQNENNKFSTKVFPNNITVTHIIKSLALGILLSPVFIILWLMIIGGISDFKQQHGIFY